MKGQLKDVVMVPINQVKPYPENSKYHKSMQIRRVANSIEQYGWDQPIIVDEDFVIIKGHCRLEAAKLLELTEVPIMVNYSLSENDKRAARIVDNKSAESDWELDHLWSEIEALKAEGLEVKDIGFTDKQIESLFPQQSAAAGIQVTPKEHEILQTVQVGEEGHDPTSAIVEVTVKTFRGADAWLRKLPMIDYLNMHDQIIVGYSGGKDSLAALLWLYDHCDPGKIRPYFSNLGWGVDWPHGIAAVFAFEKAYGHPVFIAGNTNPDAFIKNLLDFNFPHPVSCWLRNKFKIPNNKGFYAQEKIGRKYGEPGKTMVQVLGIRWAEDETRAKTYPDRGILDGEHFASPLIGWKDADIAYYLNKKGVPLNTAYQHSDRMGCIICPNESRQGCINTRKKFPQLFKQILEWVCIGGRKGRLSTLQLTKMLGSIKDFPEDEKFVRFESTYADIAMSGKEEEDYIEKVFGEKLPIRPYLSIPYDPRYHQFRGDLTPEFFKEGVYDTEVDVSICTI